MTTMFDRLTEATESPEQAKSEAVKLVTKRLGEITGKAVDGVQPVFGDSGLDLTFSSGSVKVRLMSEKIVLVTGRGFPEASATWLGHGANLRAALANMHRND